ncbi:hypothetical protein lerEdw1_004194 [Lerista edwardsae]|nr:hypothetical protein lerEdw1_004194 [Lerista edwardsae]
MTFCNLSPIVDSAKQQYIKGSGMVFLHCGKNQFDENLFDDQFLQHALPQSEIFHFVLDSSGICVPSL